MKKGAFVWILGGTCAALTSAPQQAVADTPADRVAAQVASCLEAAPEVKTITLGDLTDEIASARPKFPAKLPDFLYGSAKCPKTLVTEFKATSATKVSSKHFTVSVALGGRSGAWPKKHGRLSSGVLVEAECKGKSGAAKDKCELEAGDLTCRRLVVTTTLAWKKHGWPAFKVFHSETNGYEFDKATNLCTPNSYVKYSVGKEDYDPKTKVGGKKQGDTDGFQAPPKGGETDLYRVIVEAGLVKDAVTDKSGGKPNGRWLGFTNPKDNKPNPIVEHLPAEGIVKGY